jgi:hypothetical protein
VASLVAVVALPVIRGVLDERRLVGMDASALSAFAGARGGRSAPPCEREIRKIKLTPLESGASGGAMAYLRVEKPHYLFLEGSTGAEATADVSTISLPDASAARVGTSAACAASSVDRPTVGASTPAPGTRSSVASAALGEGGAGSHLSRGACPPSLSSSSSPDDEYSDVAGGESPCCSRSWNSSSLCSRRSRRWIPRSFLRAAHSCSRRYTARARVRARGMGRSDRAAFTATLC